MAFDSVLAAIQTLNDSGENLLLAQQWLLGYRDTVDAWAVSLRALSQPGPPPVQLYAAQTLRYKLNVQGHILSAPELVQLRDQLLHLLAARPASGPVASQLCLALVSLALLLPEWQDMVAVAWRHLAPGMAALLLQLTAEEAAGDMRHITPPTKAGAHGEHTARCDDCYGSTEQPAEIKFRFVWYMCSSAFVPQLSCPMAAQASPRCGGGCCRGLCINPHRLGSGQSRTRACMELRGVRSAVPLAAATATSMDVVRINIDSSRISHSPARPPT